MKEDIEYIDEWFQDNEVMSSEDYNNLMLKAEQERK